jgi:hypothetical protein
MVRTTVERITDERDHFANFSTHFRQRELVDVDPCIRSCGFRPGDCSLETLPDHQYRFQAIRAE